MVVNGEDGNHGSLRQRRWVGGVVAIEGKGFVIGVEAADTGAEGAKPKETGSILVERFDAIFGQSGGVASIGAIVGEFSRREIQPANPAIFRGKPQRLCFVL